MFRSGINDSRNVVCVPRRSLQGGLSHPDISSDFIASLTPLLTET